MQNVQREITFDRNEEIKQLQYIMKWVDTCAEAVHPFNWNPDWHKCPICGEGFNEAGYIHHKPRANLIN